jgi:CO/xanthine dehydrogenase Mo-binding subunit
MIESVGKPVDRVDGRLKVTGAATYTAEFPVKNVAYGVSVLSSITKGRVKNIDIAQAKRMPGIIGVMTSENSMQLHFRLAQIPETVSSPKRICCRCKMIACFTEASILLL